MLATRDCNTQLADSCTAQRYFRYVPQAVTGQHVEFECQSRMQRNEQRPKKAIFAHEIAEIRHSPKAVRIAEPELR